jgi:hypothetical protein
MCRSRRKNVDKNFPRVFVTRCLTLDDRRSIDDAERDRFCRVMCSMMRVVTREAEHCEPRFELRTHRSDTQRLGVFDSDRQPKFHSNPEPAHPRNPERSLRTNGFLQVFAS